MPELGSRFSRSGGRVGGSELRDSSTRVQRPGRRGTDGRTTWQQREENEDDVETPPEPEILYEDADLLVVNKPARLLSQADARGSYSLVTWARKHLRGGFVGLVHRLDRDVTGACVLAKSPESAKWLSRQIAERRVCKEYIAVVRRWDFEGVQLLENTMSSDDTGQSHEADDSEKGSRSARLVCRALKQGPGGAAAVLVRLLTGRRHQIRFQLAEANGPILGDVRYGSRSDGSWKLIKRPALHAWRLKFAHPRIPHDEFEVEAPLPQDLNGLLSALQIRPEVVMQEAAQGIVHPALEDETVDALDDDAGIAHVARTARGNS